MISNQVCDINQIDRMAYDFFPKKQSKLSIFAYFFTPKAALVENIEFF